MADKEIPELTAADPLDGSELIHVVQSGNSRLATVADVGGANTLDDLSDVDAYEPADGDILVWDSSAQAWVNAQPQAAGLALPAEWTPNFSDDGDVYIPAAVAMTIDQGNAPIGTGSLAYAKSTAADPDDFTSVTLPEDLEAGAWLKVSATGVSGFLATHLVRTA